MKEKYEIESTKKYGIKRKFTNKSDAVKSIKNYLHKGYGNHFYLNAIDSTGKYIPIEDYFKIKTSNNRSKIEKQIRRKLSDLD